MLMNSSIEEYWHFLRLGWLLSAFLMTEKRMSDQAAACQWLTDQEVKQHLRGNVMFLEQAYKLRNWCFMLFLHE